MYEGDIPVRSSSGFLCGRVEMPPERRPQVVPFSMLTEGAQSDPKHRLAVVEYEMPL